MEGALEEIFSSQIGEAREGASAITLPVWLAALEVCWSEHGIVTCHRNMAS
jgi:hypothetical protein